jgi:hypothetical protein
MFFFAGGASRARCANAPVSPKRAKRGVDADHIVDPSGNAPSLPASSIDFFALSLAQIRRGGLDSSTPYPQETPKRLDIDGWHRDLFALSLAQNDGQGRG